MDLVLLACAIPEGEFLAINVLFILQNILSISSVCRWELQIKALLGLPEVQLRFCAGSCQVEKELILISCVLLT